MSGFLEQLQESSPERKRRWLVMGSALTMVVVVYFWLAYFNRLIAAGVASDDNVPQTASVATTQGPTFVDTMQRGVSVLKDKVKSTPQFFVKLFESPREYTITP